MTVRTASRASILDINGFPNMERDGSDARGGVPLESLDQDTLGRQHRGASAIPCHMREALQLLFAAASGPAPIWASIGGNIMQRTRLRLLPRRDWFRCTKRKLGGPAVRTFPAFNRTMRCFRIVGSCVGDHPSDLAVRACSYWMLS